MKHFVLQGLLWGVLLISSIETFYPGVILNGLSVEQFIVYAMILLIVGSIVFKIDLKINDKQEVLWFLFFILVITILNLLNSHKETFISFNGLFYWVLIAIGGYKIFLLLKKRVSDNE